MQRFRKSIHSKTLPLGLSPDWHAPAADFLGEADQKPHCETSNDSLISLTSTLADTNFPRLPGSSIFATLVVASTKPAPSTTLFVRGGMPAEIVRQGDRGSKALTSFVVQLPIDALSQGPAPASALTAKLHSRITTIKTVLCDLKYGQVHFAPMHERPLLGRGLVSLFSIEGEHSRRSISSFAR